MFENIINFFKNIGNKQDRTESDSHSKNAAKERLHLVLMQDRANVSADFLELMKQEIIEVIKKYIDVDEKEIDVRLTNQENPDGTNGAPALYANIPIINIKNDARKIGKKELESKKEEEKSISNEAEKSDVSKEEEDKRIEKEAIEIIEDSNAKIQEKKNKEENKTETSKITKNSDDKIQETNKKEISEIAENSDDKIQKANKKETSEITENNNDEIQEEKDNTENEKSKTETIDIIEDSDDKEESKSKNNNKKNNGNKTKNNNKNENSKIVKETINAKD